MEHPFATSSMSLTWLVATSQLAWPKKSRNHFGPTTLGPDEEHRCKRPLRVLRLLPRERSQLFTLVGGLEMLDHVLQRLKRWNENLDGRPKRHWMNVHEMHGISSASPKRLPLVDSRLSFFSVNDWGSLVGSRYYNLIHIWAAWWLRAITT